MSDIASNPVPDIVPQGHDVHSDGHAHHNPHLAHHFDTPEQQFDSGKLGMWTFLATEILMFGGLFCAYAVYRHNHPEVFEFAHHFLNKTLGGVNTVVLITSSLTMAWGVRASQLGQIKLLIVLLALTIIGGAAFMGIKTIEYEHKYHENVWVGRGNYFNKNFAGDKTGPVPGSEEHGGADAPGSAGREAQGNAQLTATKTPSDAPHGATPVVVTPVHEGNLAEVSSGYEGKTVAKAEQNLAHPAPGYVDPNATSGDAAKIVPVYTASSGITESSRKLGAFNSDQEQPEAMKYESLRPLEKERVNTFFSIYYVMTGLHGVHVLVGMALIFWILVRSVSPQQRRWVLPTFPMLLTALLIYVGLITHSHTTTVVGSVLTLLTIVWFAGAYFTAKPATAPGEFGPDYYTPVDLIGLYWHIVDLIWIFLFPLLYLIH